MFAMWNQAEKREIGILFANSIVSSGKLVGAGVSKTSSAGSSPASGDFKT